MNLWASVALAQPRLAIDGPLFDFGQVDQGMTVDHVFRLVNQGTEPLTLEQVQPSCGCTVAVTSATIIPPGQSGELTIQLDTLKLAGHTTKTVAIHSNDPAVPVAGITLTGNVLADVVAAPATLYLGRLRRGSVGQFAVAVSPGRPGAAVEITGVQPGSRYLTTRIDPVLDGPGQRVIVETSPEIPLGKFNAEVRISTTSARTPTVVIPVFGVIEG